MEWFDQYDEEGNLLSQQVSRTEAHTQGIWHKTIHLWLCNAQGELLWQKRSLAKDTNPGLWDISVAGHISAGQTPVEAAIRETKEEAGIQISAENLIHLFSVKNEFRDPLTQVFDREFQEVFFYSRAVELPLTIPDPHEVSEFRFLPLSQLVDPSQDFFRVDHSEEYSKLYHRLISAKNESTDSPYSL